MHAQFMYPKADVQVAVHLWDKTNREDLTAEAKLSFYKAEAKPAFYKAATSYIIPKGCQPSVGHSTPVKG